MSDTETQETTAVEQPVTMVPADDMPPEEGEVLAPPVAAPAVSENPTTPAADGTAPAAPAADGPKERAAASDLEGDLRRVLDDYVSGLLKLPDGQMPTPHTLAALIAERRGNGLKVSSGAVSAALARWVEIGFATVSEKPTKFVDYTEAARTQGLSALKAAHRAAKSAERQANKPPKPVAVATPDTAPAAPVENVGQIVADSSSATETTDQAAEPTPGPAPEPAPAADVPQPDDGPVAAEAPVETAPSGDDTPPF